ncbi:MAG: NUDIX domain-containing protein [Chloroflexota bacterium]|nr:NUDIX domain-containing protein [Chloroflexota bacterium]
MGARQQGADATQHRWLTMPRTLSFVINGDDVLMLKRDASKRVFPNQYNGLGGHVERDEDVRSSALREIEEESGLIVHSLRLCSIHNIDAGEASGILLFIFTAISDSRDLKPDTPEGALEWISIDKILDYDLVEDLPQLLPRIFNLPDKQGPLYAHIGYDEEDKLRLRFVEPK